ncbi:mitochondrial carrier domain-containing protein [Pyronema domesticum]|uniref:Mitochondrial glycine transporter n=1 Tax=Pyronema omphalodes (strain CBS 100304) TaxID=1076935 RepID=U4LIY1_PYROM|nr:mitochondrial carrier domain-containing protein [Pyronema domesticum]CCX32064.1 Similar to Solute carrier family 25 member 38 homolog; acc. no. B2VSU4 [Pyronema omphalodes CBS 100304]
MANTAPTQTLTTTTTPAPVAKSKSHFLSGGAGGLVSAVALQPADLLKTRLQQAPPSSSATATLFTTLKSIAAGPSPIRQLWRGTLPSAIRTGAGSAMYFSTLNFVRSTLARRHIEVSKSQSSSLPKLSALENLGAGAVTRATIGYIVMPVTVIKVRFESSHYKYTSLADACKDIWRAEGVRGFFSGWGATAIRDAPYAGLYVLFYEQAKRSLSVLYGRAMDDNTAMMINSCAGASAAAAATAVTNPFDALKTRIQIHPEKYRNMWQAAKLVCNEEAGKRWRGRALFDGLGLRVARKAVSSAVAWGLYERMVR